MTEISTKSTVPFETKGRNKYLYDRCLKKTILCHPILFFLAQMKTHGEDIQSWFESLTDYLIEIPDIGTYTKDEISYYYRKLLFLEEAGYFTDIQQEKILTMKITQDSIRSTIANLTQITFEMTDQCPMDCYYCGYGDFYGDYDKRENKHMGFSMIKQVLDYLNEWINSSLNLSHNRPLFIGFYGGEPMLNLPVIKEAVKYANSLHWKHNIIRFTVTTNGLFLDKAMDFLVEHDFNIFISLDGSEKNNVYRVFKNGKPTYECVLKNVNQLQERYPDFFQHRVYFNAVLHNRNSVEEIFTYFEKQFSKKPSILPLNTSGICSDKVDEFWKVYVNATESLYNSEDYSRLEEELFIKLPTIQDIAGFMFNSFDFYYNSYKNFFSPREILKRYRYPTSTCVPFSKKMFLTVNGKILACERIGQQFELGWIKPEGINLDYQEIADRYNRWFSLLRKQCQSCYIYDHCPQCMFYLDLEKDDLICTKVLNLAKYSRYISNYFSYFEENPSLFDKIFKEVMIE